MAALFSVNGTVSDQDMQPHLMAERHREDIMRLLSSENYAEQMKNIVLPYLTARKEEGTWERIPGQKLYFEYFKADIPKGTVVMVHGFTEAIEKYYENVWYFLQEGYHVWLFQQRGHGKSFRGILDKTLVYIEHFEDLIKDLNSFIKGKVLKDPGTIHPLIYFGHSMGGGVGGCYLEKFPEVFDKAILSSPMMELSSGSAPVWAAASYARLMGALKRDKSPMPGSLPFSGIPDFEKSCSNCRERFEYWFSRQKAEPDYQMCVTPIRTAFEFLRLTRFVTDPENCKKVRAKTLLLQAGKDFVVKNGGQDRFIGLIKNGRKVVFPNAKHEIYMGQDSDLKVYWKTIMDFLAEE